MSQTSLPYSADATKSFATITDAGSVHTQAMALSLLSGTVPVPVSVGAQTTANSIPVALPTDLALPLPTGAATSAAQTTGNSSLSTIATNTTGLATAANQTSELSKLDTLHNDLVAALPSGANLIGKVGIDQTTPGTTNAVVVTGTVPLPTGAATAANQTTGNSSLATIATNTTGAATNAGITGASSKTLTDVVNTLGTPLQAGGSVSATLNALAATTLPTGATFPVMPNTPKILAYPSSQSFTATGVSQFTVEPGATYCVTLTNAPASTAGYVATVGFQWSPDGTAWNNANLIPVSSLPGAGKVNVNSSTAPGLWQWEAPTNAQYFRFNCSAYTSGTVWGFIDPWVAGTVVQIPWTYTVTSGQTVVPFLDANFIQQITVRVSAVTTTVLTVQGTNDPTGTDVIGINYKDSSSNSSGGAATISAAGIAPVPTFGFKWVRVQCTTTGTVLTLQGVSAVLGVAVAPGSAYNNGVYAITDYTRVGGTTATSASPNGSANKSVGGYITTAISNTDQSATAFGGSGRVNGTVVASTTGSGACISSEVNVSALTLGTATSIVAILQESTGGTNFTDIWVSDPVTTTGIIRVPALPVAGRRRWCVHSIGGTSTTVTVTVTTLELPPGYVCQRQFRDSYAATNPLATVINSVTQTASTFGAATALTATTQATSWFNVEGCKTITAFMTLAGSPTVTTQPVVSLEFSNDLTNGFVPTGATMTAAGNGTYSCSVTGQCWRYARLRVTTAAVYSAGAYTIAAGAVGAQGVN